MFFVITFFLLAPSVPAQQQAQAAQEQAQAQAQAQAQTAVLETPPQYDARHQNTSKLTSKHNPEEHTIKNKQT